MTRTTPSDTATMLQSPNKRSRAPLIDRTLNALPHDLPSTSTKASRTESSGSTREHASSSPKVSVLVAKTPSKGLKQRSLNPAFSSSLLRPTARVENGSLLPPARGKATQSPIKVGRATPMRATKLTAPFTLHEESDGQDLNVEESEWHGSEAEDSSEEDSVCDTRPLISLTTRTRKHQLLQQQASLSSYEAYADAIDLTFSEDDSQPANVAHDHRFLASAVVLAPDYSSTTSNQGLNTTIKFSPPRLKSPSKTPHVLRPATPPQSPSKSRLASPKKPMFKIPPTPHRQSLDSFWNQDVVNTWNDHHSPRKQLESPRKIPLPDSSEEEDDSLVLRSPSKRSPAKQDRKAVARRKRFEAERHQIAQDFLRDLDTRITDNSIGQLTESTGGVQLIWSKKLNSTAGRANWKREAVRSRAPDGTVTTTAHRHVASIELAEKVIDNEERLLNVLAHEFCHLANFMVSHKLGSPHGASFKRWASRVTSQFSDRGVEVTTKHSYSISYKYAWMCESCSVEYQRHSKSIDPTKHACGKCKGKLVQVRPVPRAGATGEGSPKKSDYQIFVKENFSTVKEELGPRSPMKDVMKELGTRYRAAKVTATTAQGGEATKDEESTNDSEFKETAAAENGDVEKVARVLDFLTIGDN